MRHLAIAPFSPQQAARDKERALAFLTSGRSTARFTGSQIYRDPLRCVSRIGDLQSWMAWNLLVELGLDEGRKESHMRSLW